MGSEMCIRDRIGTTSPNRIATKIAEWADGVKPDYNTIKSDVEELSAENQIWQEDLMRDGIRERIKTMYENLNVAIYQMETIRNRMVGLSLNDEEEMKHNISKLTKLNRTIVEMYGALISLTTGNPIVLEQMQKYISESQQVITSSSPVPMENAN